MIARLFICLYNIVIMRNSGGWWRTWMGCRGKCPSLSKIPLLLAGRAAQAETQKELRLRTLMPSILDKTFKGELLDEPVNVAFTEPASKANPAGRTPPTCLLGALVGDVIGSLYEFSAQKSTDFPLFCEDSELTDDSILTLAVADAIVNGRSYLECIREYAMVYPDSGYGGFFRQWMYSNDPQPYDSFGNGSAMRVSPIGWAFDTVEDVLREAEASAAVTHNHPEGIKGAQAVALAIFRARNGSTKDEIRKEITGRFGYDLSRTVDEIRLTYQFDETCQKTVPPAIVAFLESENFEDAIRKAVSLGGDADTLAAITGSIAEAYYGGAPEEIATEVCRRVPIELQDIVERFSRKYFRRADSGPF